MTFNQINYFLAVAKHLSFSRAATELFVTQSTLSRSISALETEIGVTLLERDFHNVKLTSAGELFNREMVGMMSGVNDLIRRVQAVGDAECDRLVLGILDGQEIDPSVLVALKNLSERFPNVGMDIRRMNHKDLINEVKAGHLDAAETIMSSDTALDPGLDYFPIKEVSSYLIARDDSVIWEREISIKALDGVTLVTSPDSHLGVASLKKVLKQAGVTPKIKVANDVVTQSLWLGAGMVAAICNQGQVMYTSRSFNSLKAVLLEDVPRVTIALVWKKDRTTQMLNHFLNHVRADLLEIRETQLHSRDT